MLLKAIKKLCQPRVWVVIRTERNMFSKAETFFTKKGFMSQYPLSWKEVEPGYWVAQRNWALGTEHFEAALREL